MNITSWSRSKPVRFLGRLLCTAAVIFVIGASSAPAVSAADESAILASAASSALMTTLVATAATSTTSVPASSSTVTVDQQPLTLQPAIPPDIVLMFDDSGSMAWDFMPDAYYLTGHITVHDENWYQQIYVSADALRSSSVNGTYYNPSVTYTVPVHADGTSYPTPTSMASAYADPFTSTSTTLDLTQHHSPWLCDYNGYSTTQSGNYACPNSLYYAFPYYTAFPSGSTAYQPTLTCPYGVSLQNGYCFYSTSYGYYVPTPTCPNGGTYNAATGYCETGATTYTYLFTYTTPGTTAGTYVRHYVGKSATDCAAAPTGSDCVYDSVSRQNVATWFSYYRKRVLMAKSGLMTAFSGVDKNFRIGFGSINGNNNSNLPSPTGTFGGNSNKIAEAQPFGDGSSGTQKAKFWTWVAGLNPSGGTPLRYSLDAVGKYYQDSSGQAWSTMSSDPTYGTSSASTEIACRQAYTILTTDGFWNGDYPGSGNTGVGDVDGVNGPTNTGPSGQSYQYTAAAPYSDTADPKTTTYTNTLADVAMKYWETDLRPSTLNEVPPSTDDPAFWQHMTTFTMGLGFAPLYADQKTPIPMDQVFSWANGGPAISGFSWPQPAGSGGSGGSINNIADLAHAAVNGHGGFYSATNPQAFASGISDALRRAAERVGTGASLASNSTQLTTGTVVYQANYYTAKWKGDLKALSVNAATGAIASTPTWTASSALPAAASRNIQTYNPSTGKFVAFQNGSTAPPSLSSAQLAALDPSGANNSSTEMDMVNYLRGDSSKEQSKGGNFRNRDTALGDIVDSQPVYSGAPNPNEFINQSFTGYSATTSASCSTATSSPFYDWAVSSTDCSGNVTASAASSRTPLVFVSANDGMLHAFNASTGAEVFAYLPGAVINQTNPLANLSNPAYGNGGPAHQYYNDGEVTIADAYVKLPSDTAAAWHTILVGTTGRGLAKAVYALDITNPASITPLWERSAGDGLTNSGYIGQMVGKPVIAQVADAQWAVLIGNGYNSANGVSALLQFDLATGTLSVHKTTDTTTGNGLAAPVAYMDTPSTGVSDIAYAGDLHGQVWSFTLSTVTTSGNGKNQTTTITATPTSTGTKLFTAKDTSGNVQPITSGLAAGKNPQDGNVWLFFGTGQYLSSSDLSNTSVQSWYGIIVQSSTSSLVSNLSNGRTALVTRQIIAETAGDTSTNPPTLPARAVTAAPATSDMSGKSGWVMDLESPNPNGASNPTAQGERMVVPNILQGNLLIGTTRIPQVTDICNPSGRGWIMAVDPFTGTNPASNFFDTNGDGLVNGGDMITLSDGTKVAAAGVGFSSLPNAPIFVGGIMEVSFDNGTTASLKTSGSGGTMQRVSWREMVND